MTSHWTLESLIAETDGLSDDAQTAKELFEYTQFLLDQEDSLTKTGNLNRTAKDALNSRIFELLGSKHLIDKDENK